MIEPMVSITKLGHHRRLRVNASLKLSGPKMREAYPASKPLTKTRNALKSKAAKVCPNNRNEPAMAASESPIHGVSTGATRMPKKINASELTKYHTPRIKPATSEKTKSSYDG